LFSKISQGYIVEHRKFENEILFSVASIGNQPMRMNIFRDFIVEHRKLKIEILFPVASIGNQSMRINILFSYIVMNTRGRGEPMHHQPITISKGGDHGFNVGALF
jgi:hypothetical protein